MTIDTVTMNNEEKSVEKPVEAPVAEEQKAPEAPIEAEAPEVEKEDSAPEIEERKVPLSALQKERRKRQEIEMELKVYKEQIKPSSQEPVADDSQYEAVTKADLGKNQAQIIRAVEERNWIRDNPEKAEFINEKLSDFLKQRPNLAAAIEGVTNRYEEAWELMDKLTPKQKASLKASKPVLGKDAPGSPAAIPKAAAINQAVDVMSMTDDEFAKWRQSQRKRR
jgi:hypothetical protein